MKKTLIVLLLTLSASASADTDMDMRGNPALYTVGNDRIESQPVKTGKMAAIDKNSGLFLLAETLAIFEKYYYKEVDERVLAEKILEGGLPAFDKFCHYANPEQQKLEQESATGHFSGIGAHMDQELVNKEPVLNIMSVLSGGPAEKAGLQSGDLVLAIAKNGVKKDAVSTDKLSINDSVKMIRGEKGTPVYLLIERDGKALEFTIMRDDIKEVIVSGKMISPGVAYVKLNAFHGDEMLSDFSALVSSMQARGAKVLIFDMRNNPGGFVNQAVTISGWWKKGFSGPPGNTIITMQYRNHKETLRQFGPGKFENLPVVILVNKGSASASEMTTAYLKNYAGAIVIGTTTYGKGVGQSVIDNMRSGGRIAITSFEYFVGPKDVKVHEVGVIPTIEIKQDKPAKTEKEDAQLQRAILEAEKLVK